MHHLLFLLPVLSILAACGGGDERPPLEGERLSVLELERSLVPDVPQDAMQSFALPKPWRNEFWPQAGGYPNHGMQHLALPGLQDDSSLERIWEADIGQGSDDEIPLTAQPIVVDGKIFTLDTDASLRAFDIQNGKEIWEADVSHPNEDDRVISGGIGFSSGRLYVTNGYDELIAVNPNDGAIVWRQKIAGPSRAAPTIMGGRIFISTLDHKLLTLDERDGRLLWEYVGIGEDAGLLGAAAPAANHDIVVPVFSSGEISALRVENGSVAWSDNLANVRRIGSLAGISDIKALPVIDQGLVFAISFSGKMVAIDERTGVRVWQRDLGGSETPWLAGNHFFVLTAENDLAAMNRTNGQILWVSPMPRYEDPEDREDPILWTGPVLAGNVVLLAGSNGDLLQVDPQSGQILQRAETSHSFTIPPLVAGGRLYLLSEAGRLIAFE